jgi:site-specific DNA recombinase
MRKTYCAIYTRKSSDEGLEQEFNSLDAQREACEAFIKSQKHEGWVCLPAAYDDGGLSGGTMERPALKRLLAEIEAGKVHIVVVYKVDRLTRSLADFAKIVDVLDAAGASFVSVTQQFNTTTSMGRLTLNMLLSFAQFEREIASERIRDKIAASKAKGMWMGGNVPLGYDVKDRKLIVNELEAEAVRTIFRTYLDVRSVRQLRIELDRFGIVSKRRERAQGVLAGGKPFSRGTLYTLLQNPIYQGKISHKGKVHPGQHERIIDEELWSSVQELLANNRHDQFIGAAANCASLLAGLIVDADGQSMKATHANKKGKRYRYYVSAPLISGEGVAGPNAMRVPAGEIESLVVGRLRELVAARNAIAEALAPLRLNARQTELVLASANRCARASDGHIRFGQPEALRQCVKRVTAGANCVEVELDLSGLVAILIGEAFVVEQRVSPFVMSIEAKLTRAGKGKRIVIDADGPGVDQALIKLLREALAMRRVVCDGGSPEHQSEAWTSTYRARRIALLRLSYLAPHVVRVILNGRQPADLSAKRLIALSNDLPMVWANQLRYLGMGTA